MSFDTANSPMVSLDGRSQPVPGTSNPVDAANSSSLEGQHYPTQQPPIVSTPVSTMPNTQLGYAPPSGGTPPSNPGGSSASTNTASPEANFQDPHVVDFSSMSVLDRDNSDDDNDNDNDSDGGADDDSMDDLPPSASTNPGRGPSSTSASSRKKDRKTTRTHRDRSARSWAKGPVWDYFKSRVADFQEAQTGCYLPAFWTETYAHYFRLEPAEEPYPEVPNKQKTPQQLLCVKSYYEAKYLQIRNWFNNQGRRLTPSNAPRAQKLFKHLIHLNRPTRRRGPQLLEMYKRQRKAEIADAVKARAKTDKRRRPEIHRAVAQELWEKEPQEVKDQITAAHTAELGVKSSGQLEAPNPGTLGSVIESVHAVIAQMCEQIHEQTGLTFSVSIGGVLTQDGAISSGWVHVPKNDLGVNFGSYFAPAKFKDFNTRFQMFARDYLPKGSRDDIKASWDKEVAFRNLPNAPLRYRKGVAPTPPLATDALSSMPTPPPATDALSSMIPLDPQLQNPDNNFSPATSSSSLRSDPSSSAPPNLDPHPTISNSTIDDNILLYIADCRIGADFTIASCMLSTLPRVGAEDSWKEVCPALISSAVDEWKYARNLKSIPEAVAIEGIPKLRDILLSWWDLIQPPWRRTPVRSYTLQPGQSWGGLRDFHVLKWVLVSLSWWGRQLGDTEDHEWKKVTADVRHCLQSMSEEPSKPPSGPPSPPAHSYSPSPATSSSAPASPASSMANPSPRNTASAGALPLAKDSPTSNSASDCSPSLAPDLSTPNSSSACSSSSAPSASDTPPGKENVPPPATTTRCKRKSSAEVPESERRRSTRHKPTPKVKV